MRYACGDPAENTLPLASSRNLLVGMKWSVVTQLPTELLTETTTL